MAGESGIYLASPPTLADQQQSRLRVDSTGALVTTGGGSGGGGTDNRVPQGSDGTTQTAVFVQGKVVTGDQGYTVGQTQGLNMTPDGRLKVAVSYAANVTPAAKATSNNNAALIAAVRNTTKPAFSDGFTGAVQASRLGSLNVLSETLEPTPGTNLSGTATTTSGNFNIPANANRRPGDVQGQNVSASAVLYVNEFGGTAAANTAGSYMVPAGQTFIVTSNGLVNFAASASCPVTITSV